MRATIAAARLLWKHRYCDTKRYTSAIEVGNRTNGNLRTKTRKRDPRMRRNSRNNIYVSDVNVLTPSSRLYGDTRSMNAVWSQNSYVPSAKVDLLKRVIWNVTCDRSIEYVLLLNLNAVTQIDEMSCYNLSISFFRCRDPLLFLCFDLLNLKTKKPSL